MKVLRVEHKEDCIGPYQGRTSEFRLQSNRMPIWWEDGNDNETVKDRQYGFISFDQLRRWFGSFPEDCFMLHNRGFHVVICDAPREEIAVARSQAIFPREKAKVVGKFDLTRILK